VHLQDHYYDCVIVHLEGHYCGCVAVHLQGHFVRKLGDIGDKDTENEVLLLEHDIPHSVFSEAVLKCLPSLPWVITKEVTI